MKSKEIKVGKCLNNGSYKECWTVGSNRVALTSMSQTPSEQYDFLKKELKYLLKLKKYGIPCAEGHLVKVIKPSGEKAWAILMKRYYSHGFSFNAGNSKRKRSKYHKNIRKSLMKIYKVLLKNNISVYDLQFLVDKKGNAVIADPLGVDKLRKGAYNDSLGDLEYMLGIENEDR